MKVLEGTGGGSSSRVDPMADRLCERFDMLLADMAGIGDRTLVSLAARCEQRLETARLLAVARLAGGDGDARSQRRRARAHLSGGRKGRSNRSVNRDARRAAALAANPGLSEQAGNGSLSGDGIDALSKAADDTTGEIPADLLDLTSGVDPDQSARLVEQYLLARVAQGGPRTILERDGPGDEF